MIIENDESSSHDLLNEAFLQEDSSPSQCYCQKNFSGMTIAEFTGDDETAELDDKAERLDKTKMV